MKYCFDTSALIDLGERRYPESVKAFGSIWEQLYQGVDKGEIVSSHDVKRELEEKAGEWRAKFIQHCGKMFLIDEGIEGQYSVLIREIEANPSFRVNKHRERFFSGADPWIIAVARSVGESTVVSSETKSLTDYGLGTICKSLSVEHISLLDYLKAAGI